MSSSCILTACNYISKDDDDYFNRTTLGNVQDIRERLAGFLMMEVINKKGELHF
jgi:hypothetical protein